LEEAEAARQPYNVQTTTVFNPEKLFFGDYEAPIIFYQLLLQLCNYLQNHFTEPVQTSTSSIQNVCVDLNQIVGYSWKIIKTFLCEFEPENYF
jgi:hypothetical protein